jgi:hypothetical protein
MQDYWVNVYEGLDKLPLNAFLCCFSREHAIIHSRNCLNILNEKTLYRIHVKMKPAVFKNTEEGRRAWETP